MMMMITKEAKILFTVVFWALAGVSIPSSSLHAGVAVVDAFVATTAPSRCQTPNHHRHFPTIEYGSASFASRQTMFSSSPTKGSSPKTTTTSLESAKILPLVYIGFSGGLVLKSRAATCVADKIVLLAMSVISITLVKSDSARLKSAKLACKKTTMAISADTTDTAGTGKEEKQPSKEALAWRKAVRFKILGQLVGLLRMALAKESKGILRGAAFVLGSSVQFLVSGGRGSVHHDADGSWKPLPEETAMMRLNTTAFLFVATVVAAFRAGGAP
jgi:hypothetical protein